MGVNLKRFVDVDIQAHAPSQVTTTRDTVVLFTPEGTLNNIVDISSMNEVTYNSSSITYAYLKVFFDNGGIKARVIEGITYQTLTKAVITDLENEYIYVVCASALENRAACYSAMKTLATELNSDSTIYGINEKIILTCIEPNTYTDDSSIKNLAVKYSSVLGAEMTMAAYLSKLNIDKIDSVQDYAFTEETLLEYDSGKGEWVNNGEDISDTNYGLLQSSNINVDIKLAGAVRNLGGNNKDGSDFINNFVRIVLHQTVTDQLLNLLTQKIKSSTGISKIYTVISQELERYRNCGYLTTDKIWSDDDYVIKRNNVDYTIISRGDALLNGYIIRILPMSSLTAAEIATHSTPPIYIILADQYGIRKITINGEVI